MANLRHLDEELDEIQLDKRKNHTIEVVIDRLLVKPGIEKRLEQSVATAMKLGKGLVQVAVVNGEEHLYSARMACPDCGINIPSLEPRSFSFNSVYGACPECNGLGSKYDFDPAKIIVDWSKPLLDGALGPGSGSTYLQRMVDIVAAAYKLDLSTPFEKFPRQDPEPAALRAGRKRSAAPRLSRRARLPEAEHGGIDFRELSRMDAGLHVRDRLPGLPGQAASPGKRWREGEWALHLRLYGAAGFTLRGRGRQDPAQ